MTFVVHANLDAEARWAGRALPAAIAARVSPMAALCAALAPDGEPDVEVWTPGPIAAGRLLASAAWQPPRLAIGAPPRADLMWADDRAKSVNDRRFALATAQQLGCALPGARAVASIDDVAAHVAAGGAAASPTRAWVAKAPWTTAGRDRAFGGDLPFSGEVTNALTVLFAAHGELVFEPWLERTADVAVCGHVDGTGYVELRPPHTLITSARGTFRGIQLGTPALGPRERDALTRTALRVGGALGRAGHAGPFGVDAFVHTGGFHPLCEINARHTFGHVAHALCDRTGRRGLHFGPAPHPPGALVLVAPAIGGPSPLAAWLA